MDALLTLEIVYSKLVLRVDFDTTGSVGVAEANKILVKEMAVFVSKKRLNFSGVPLGRFPLETCIFHTMHFFVNAYKDATLLEKYQCISLLQSSEK